MFVGKTNEVQGMTQTLQHGKHVLEEKLFLIRQAGANIGLAILGFYCPFNICFNRHGSGFHECVKFYI